MTENNPRTHHTVQVATFFPHNLAYSNQT